MTVFPSKSFVVLGVDHRIQGDPDVRGAFNDLDYRALIEAIISCGKIDFVGEERNLNITFAERITDQLLGTGRYINIDIPPGEREAQEIGDTTRMPLFNFETRHDLEAHDKRESFWVKRLVEKTAIRGLLICGSLHTFSVSLKLMGLKFKVDACTYTTSPSSQAQSNSE